MARGCCWLSLRVRLPWSSARSPRSPLLPAPPGLRLIVLMAMVHHGDAGKIWPPRRLPLPKPAVSKGEKTAAALAVTVALKPGESREFCFVLAWYVPSFQQSGEIDCGTFFFFR